MMKKMRKKGLATITVLIVLGIALLVGYIILFLPIPKFQKIRALINYILIVTFWFLLQAGLIVAYYKLSILTGRGLKLYRSKIQIWTFKVKNYLLAKK